MKKPPKSILITKPSALGDIVMTLPCLSLLRKHFPESKISWLVSSEFVPFLEGHPFLDQIIPFPRKEMTKLWRDTRAVRRLVEFIRDLRLQQFDLVFDFQGLLRSALFGYLSGCHHRLGPADGREGAPLFYTDRIKPDKTTHHVIDHYLKIAQTVTDKGYPVEFIFADSSTDQQVVETLLTSHQVDTNNYCVLIPGSAHISKRWPADRFAQLADRLHNEFGLSVIAVGTSSEKNTIDTIINQTQTPPVNLAGQTSLKQLIAILRKARLVISNDTGPGHIAAGLGVPLVMLFSWSNPARIYPYGRKECIAAIEPFDRPEGIKSYDPKYNVSNISFDTVYIKACEQLSWT